MEFRPSRDGFRFANRFAVPGVRVGYGLCGGMAALAAEAFLAGERLPQDPAPPAPGTPLFRRLWRCQLATLGAPRPDGTWRYVRWMRMDADERAARTAAELRRARAALAAGHLVLLGLVLTDRLVRVADNHQVLAYAEAAGGALRVYDPNRPGRDDVLLRAARLTGGGPDRRVLGVFVTQTLPPHGAAPAGEGGAPS